MSDSTSPQSSILHYAMRFCSSRKRATLYHYYQKSRTARITIISLALVTQVLALLLTGFVGMLLGVFVRTILS